MTFRGRPATKASQLVGSTVQVTFKVTVSNEGRFKIPALVATAVAAVPTSTPATTTSPRRRRLEDAAPDQSTTSNPGFEDGMAGGTYGPTGPPQGPPHHKLMTKMHGDRRLIASTLGCAPATSVPFFFSISRLSLVVTSLYIMQKKTTYKENKKILARKNPKQAKESQAKTRQDKSKTKARQSGVVKAFRDRQGAPKSNRIESRERPTRRDLLEGHLYWGTP
jgi:hypothetical protein